MPLFRIMGGGNNASSSNANNDPNNPNSSSSSSRYTYPGHRATAAPSLPGAPPRTGFASSSPQVVIRGSNVGAAVAVGAPGMPHPTNSGSSINRSSNPSVGSSVSSTGSAPTASFVEGSSSSSTIVSPTNRPGAYQVTRTSEGPAQVYRVTVPAGVRPGAEFSVHAGPRRVRVRCPPTSRPGQSLQITLPPEPITHHTHLRMAPITAALQDTEPSGGAVAMTDDVRKVNEQAAASGGTAQTFLVTIPPNVYPGMQFTVNVCGQRFMVTCPATAGPNQKVRIVPPVVREEPEAAPTTQVFEVNVPPGVQPGQPFALVANAQRVLVTCPPNVAPGQKIRFQLPVSQVIENIELKYESETGGWRRTVRVTDLKFQWVRMDNKKDKMHDDKKQTMDDATTVEEDPLADATGHVDLEGMEQFDFLRSAYVRKIAFMEGNDARMRTGTLELGPAHEAVVDSRLVVHNRTLMSYADIANVQGSSLQEKTEWFQRVCTQLTSAWEDGHIKMVIRRQFLLLDSVDAIMSLGRDDLRKRWRIEFLGEPGIDAGGVAREWFELVTEQMFDPAFGLWVASVNNQACVNINPASGKKLVAVVVVVVI